MRRAIQILAALAVSIACLTGFAPASARAATNPCAGLPTVTLQVANLSSAWNTRIAIVENAATQQSIQVHRYWPNLPCVLFGSTGWPIILENGTSVSGYHCGERPTPTTYACNPSASPYAIVFTGQQTYEFWARPFTHELFEMLANPQTTTTYLLDGFPQELEIADAYENYSYLLAGVPVTDLSLPSDFYGGAAPFDLITALHAPIYTYGTLQLQARLRRPRPAPRARRRRRDRPRAAARA